MLELIDYEDKVFLNENADIQDINKVKANDLNQIKSKTNLAIQKLKDLIKNEKSTSTQDTYSCDYINNNVGVVESGSNENGSWIKYADGTMIINQQIEITNLSVNTSWGGMYMTELGINLPSFPINFIEKPNVSISFASSTATAMIGLSDDVYVNSAGAFRLFRGTANENVSGTVLITAIGRWK